MERFILPTEDPLPTSARELLERYTYGEGEVELVLRFAEAHKLSADDTVWLMVTILRVNNRLVETLLRSIAKVEEIIEQAGAFDRQRREVAGRLASQLVGQIKGAAAMSAGTLDLRISRIESLMAKLDKIDEHLSTVTQDYRSTVNLLKADQMEDPKSLLAMIKSQLMSDARIDAHHFVSQAFRDIDFTTKPVPTALYWITGINLLISVVALIAITAAWF